MNAEAVKRSESKNTKTTPKSKAKAVDDMGAKTKSPGPEGSLPLDKSGLLQAYRTMRTIREFEERLHADFAAGDIPGFVHLYAGEEAAGTGIMMHLQDKDRIASTHRGHGHCIAKGVDPREMMAEIHGKVSGSCRGKGGSMHIADLSKGMMGANGILGAGAPLACGAALAAQKLGHKRSEEHTSELQSPDHLVCRLLLEKKKKIKNIHVYLIEKNTIDIYIYV